MRPDCFLASTLAVLGLCLPGLAQAGAGTPRLTPDANTNAPLPQVLKLPGSTAQATATTDRPRYKRGQLVRLTFKVTNTSAKSITYNFSTGQRYDVRVTDANGAEVWDWARGRTFTQNLSAVPLAPHKPLVYTVVWNGHNQAGRVVKPGTYTLSARLTSDSRPAVTGGVIVNNDRDPSNMGTPTQTPADTGAVRQVNTVPPVSAQATVTVL